MNYGRKLQALKQNTTKCQFLVLHYLRLKKQALNLSSENLQFNSPKPNLASPLIRKFI